MMTRSMVYTFALVFCLLAPASVLAHPGSEQISEQSIRDFAQGVQNEAIHKELHRQYGDRYRHVELARRQASNNITTTPSSSAPPPSSSDVTSSTTSSEEPSPSPSSVPPSSITGVVPSPSSDPVTEPSSMFLGTPSSDASSTPESTPTSTEESTTTTPKTTSTPTYNTTPITSKKTKTVTGAGGVPSTEYSTEIITPTLTNGGVATSNPSITSTAGGYNLAGNGVALEVTVMNMFAGVFAVAAGAFFL